MQHSAQKLTALINFIQPKGLTVFDVPGDGDCALHAILDQLRILLPTTTETVDTLRLGAVACIKRCSHMLELKDSLVHLQFKDLPTYFKKQEQKGEWVDEAMLRGLSEYTSRSVEIYHDSGSITTVSPFTTTSVLNLASQPLKVPSINNYATCHLFC